MACIGPRDLSEGLPGVIKLPIGLRSNEEGEQTHSLSVGICHALPTTSSGVRGSCSRKTITGQKAQNYAHGNTACARARWCESNTAGPFSWQVRCGCWLSFMMLHKQRSRRRGCLQWQRSRATPSRRLTPQNPPRRFKRVVAARS